MTTLRQKHRNDSERVFCVFWHPVCPVQTQLCHDMNRRMITPSERNHCFRRDGEKKSANNTLTGITHDQYLHFALNVH